ncbi:MAG: AAA family ATPase [Brucellaceae bacterium]|nr:AAA family ATPase [Brucellaceae bacterium]
MSNAAFEHEDIEDAVQATGSSADMAALRPVPRVSIQAFCETEGVAKPIERAGEDRRMAKTHLKVMMGGIPAAVSYYQSAPTPNLIMVESRAEPRDMMGHLAQLAEVCDPSTRVVIIGHYNDVMLYRELMKNGISEYMVAPVSLADIMGTISQIFVDPEADPLGKTLVFIGAKGGTGSSTIAHNVSWSLSSLFDSDVVIGDMDLAYGTANINFDQDPAQGMAEAVFSPERIDEVYLDRLLADCSERLSLLAAPSTLERTYDFDESAFSQIIEVAQRSAPMVVLDMPHVWNGWTRKTLAEADEVIITATPELANLRNAKNLVDTLKKARPNDTPPRLVLNQVGMPKRPEISVADFVDPLELDPLAVIPFDPLLFGNAANNGRMIGELEPGHAIAQVFNDICYVLTGRAEVKAKAKPGIGNILGKLKIKK